MIGDHVQCRISKVLKNLFTNLLLFKMYIDFPVK